MKRPIIMVVDDDRDFVEALAILLRDAGYEVREALSAAEALRIMQGAQIHLVVLDVNMPEKSGIDLLAQVRSARLYVPVILISSNHSDCTVQSGLSVGANLFVPKPFDPDYLLRSIAELLQT
jgi:DNA-binding response OmpR family regulator